MVTSTAGYACQTLGNLHNDAIKQSILRYVCKECFRQIKPVENEKVDFPIYDCCGLLCRNDIRVVYKRRHNPGVHKHVQQTAAYMGAARIAPLA